MRQLFFGLMALAMVGVRYKSDKRDQYLQHGGWFVKIALWLLFNVLAFFLPVGLVSAYGASGPCPIHSSQLSPNNPGCPTAHLFHHCVCLTFPACALRCLCKSLHLLPAFSRGKHVTLLFPFSLHARQVQPPYPCLC